MTAILPDISKVTEILSFVAETEIMPLFRRLEDHQISDKKSGEIVTAADVNAELKLTELLTALVPGSVTVGEEGFAADESVMARLAGEKPVWIIDPVDGTQNYSQGKACFCVIVAYVVAGRTLAGWIHNPIEKTTVISETGAGAFEGGKRLEIENAPPVSNMTGGVGVRRRDPIRERAADHNLDLPATFTRYRCIGLEYADLARGILHFAEFGNLKPWDHAAGLLIHKEAGGHAAFTTDNSVYTPGPIPKGRLLAAPDENCWRALRTLLAT